MVEGPLQVGPRSSPDTLSVCASPVLRSWVAKQCRALHCVFLPRQLFSLALFKIVFSSRFAEPLWATHGLWKAAQKTTHPCARTWKGRSLSLLELP